MQAEGTSPPDDSAPTRWWRSRPWLGRVVLVVFVVVGVLLFRDRLPDDVRVRFSVPTVLRTPDGPVRRAALRSIEADVLDTDGVAIGQLYVALPSGLEGPLTPAAPLQLRRGEFRLRVRLATATGRTVPRVAVLRVDGEDEVRVSLR